MAASSYVLLGVVCHLSNCHWHEWEWSVPVNWVEQFEWTNGNEWLLCDVFIKDEWPTVLLYELKKKVFNVTSLYSNSSKAIQYLYVNDWLESINVSNNIGFCMWWSLTRPLNLNMTTAFGTLHLVRREGGCGIDCRKQMNESLVESRQWEDTRIKSRTFISFTTIDFQTPQAVLLWRFPSRWDSYIGMYFSTLWLCRDAGTLCSFLRVEGKLFQTSY